MNLNSKRARRQLAVMINRLECAHIMRKDPDPETREHGRRAMHAATVELADFGVPMAFAEGSRQWLAENKE